MKVKLKKDEQISSINSRFGLMYNDWLDLNNGKTIELDSIPEALKDKLIELKQKGDK